MPFIIYTKNTFCICQTKSESKYITTVKVNFSSSFCLGQTITPIISFQFIFVDLLQEYEDS